MSNLGQAPREIDGWIYDKRRLRHPEAIWSHHFYKISNLQTFCRINTCWVGWSLVRLGSVWRQGLIGWAIRRSAQPRLKKIIWRTCQETQFWVMELEGQRWRKLYDKMGKSIQNTWLFEQSSPNSLNGTSADLTFCDSLPFYNWESVAMAPWPNKKRGDLDTQPQTRPKQTKTTHHNQRNTNPKTKKQPVSVAKSRWNVLPSSPSFPHPHLYSRLLARPTQLCIKVFVLFFFFDFWTISPAFSLVFSRTQNGYLYATLDWSSPFAPAPWSYEPPAPLTRWPRW